MDRVTELLTQQGFEVTPRHLAEGDFEGNSVHIGQAEIIYRVEDDGETVLIPLYRRTSERSGLRNSFTELLWFLEWLSQSEQGLKRVKGLVATGYDLTADQLPATRIAEFYKRIMGAKSLGRGMTGEWIEMELAQFRTLKQLRADRSKRSNPTNNA